MDPAELPLRDIHLPPPVGWWPPAPGWWLLPMAIAAVAFAVWAYRRRRRARAATVPLRALAAAELERLRSAFDSHRDSHLIAVDLSALLRRCCLSLYPRVEAAALTGEPWLALLDRPVPGNRFRDGPGRVLATAPYARRAEVDAPALLALCAEWIETLPETGATRR